MTARDPLWENIEGGIVRDKHWPQHPKLVLELRIPGKTVGQAVYLDQADVRYIGKVLDQIVRKFDAALAPDA